MALNKENSEEIMTYHADSVDAQSLKKDIEELFTIIVDQSFYTQGDVLIFIDATNGHISCEKIAQERTREELQRTW